MSEYQIDQCFSNCGHCLARTVNAKECDHLKEGGTWADCGDGGLYYHERKIAALKAENKRLRGAIEKALGIIDKVPLPAMSWHVCDGTDILRKALEEKSEVKQ